MRMTIPDEPGVAPLYGQLLRKYRELRPDVDVELELIEYDTDPQYWAKIWGSRASRGLPDIIYTHYSWFPLAVRQGAFLDIGARFKADYDEDDYFPSALASFGHEGRLYTVPRETSAIAVFYNKTMLDRAGLPDPNKLDEAGDWTWDRFREIAAAVAASHDGKWGAIAPVEIPFALFAVLRSFGSELLNVDGNVHFNTPDTLRALSLIRSMLLDDRSAVLPDDALNQESFRSGDAAMMLAGYWHMAITLDPEPEFEWDVARIPTGTCLGTRTGAGGYSIASDSPFADEAWRLIRWLSEPEQTLDLAGSGLIVPALRRAALSERFLKGRPVHRRVFIDALEYGKPDPVIVRWDAVLAIVGGELSPVWSGARSPEAAAAAIDGKLNELLGADDAFSAGPAR